MNRERRSLIVLGACLLVGCQSIHVQSAYERQVAFDKLHTFCWVAPPAWLHNDPRLRMDLVAPLVQQEVQAALEEKGFRAADCASADFQVSFTGGLSEQFVRAKAIGVPAGSIAVYQYDRETGGEWFTAVSGTTLAEKRTPSLAIEIRKPNAEEIWWQGVASANLPPAVNDGQVAERVKTAVRLILKQFPPPAGR